MSEETQAAEAGAPQKKKKINKLTSEELAKKIAVFEDARHTKSVYYKHLIQRKKELEKPAQ